MTLFLRCGLGALLLGLAGTAQAQAADEPEVLGCATLVELRVLMASGDRAAAEAALPRHPGCRRIARARIGAAEHRAMIGGAPFECLTVAEADACAWVMP